MLKYILSVLLLVGSLSAQWKDWSSYPEWDNWGKRQGSVLIPTEGLKLLVDPGRQIIAGSPQNPQKPYAPLQYGSELVDNGDFHDFTFENDANTVGHWVFSSDYHSVETGLSLEKDLSGNNHTLTPVNFLANYTEELVGTDNPTYENGNSLSFNGIDEYFETSSFSQTYPLTVEGWFKVSSLATGVLFRHDDIWIRVDSNGTIRCSNSAQADWPVFDLTSNTTIEVNKWYYFAYVVDGTTQYLYINGVLDNSSTDISNYVISGIIYIGTWSGTNQFFNGEIAAIRYSNVARTEQEIKESYGLAKGWTWDGVGSVSNSNFAQVVSGGGTVSQQVVTTSGNLYEKNVNGTISYLNENNHTVNLTDGTHTLASVRQVSNASWSGTTVLDYFFPPKFDGTMQGLMEQNQPAHPYAFNFDGVDDYIDFGNVINLKTHSWIFNGWGYFDGTNKSGMSVGTFDTWADLPRVGWFFRNDGTLSNGVFGYFYDDVGGAGVRISNSNSLIPNNWYMLSVVYDSQTKEVKCYLNGVFNKSSDFSSALATGDFTTTKSFKIGRLSDNTYATNKSGIMTFYIFDGQNGAPSSLPSNYEEIIRTIYNNTKHLYQ